MLATATATVIAAFAALIKLQQERHSVRMQAFVAMFAYPNDGPTLGTFGGDLFNKGRRVQLRRCYITLLGASVTPPVSVGPHADGNLPRWVEQGEFFEVEEDLGTVLNHVREVLAENHPGLDPVTAMSNLRFTVEDGYGHKHSRKLDPSSRGTLATWLKSPYKAASNDGVIAPVN